MSKNLIVCSLNVRGLSNIWKRRETFRWLRLKKKSIYFLQEVHSTNGVEACWLAECFSSLKTMTYNKTPGSDGLPAEFYKVFWKDISQHLLKALYANGCSSVTQSRGLITLIPVKNKDAKLLKNWRPVTLLNCDYKIASKSIANRLKLLLSKLINHDQTGLKKIGLLERTSGLCIIFPPNS